jgi:glycosyltransferase involved in cell wall biosynthesis
MKEFLGKYQKVPVQEYPHRVASKPLVSVVVQTYQHARYIKTCLEGILSQKTDFSVEILLGEDDSTDGTRQLCMDYANRYPDKIRLFLHARANNLGINGYPSGRFNFLYNLFSSRGRYIAICEGDDYWIDPNKLQKEVEFLENYPAYLMVTTDVILVDEHGQPVDDNTVMIRQRKARKPDLSFYDLLQFNQVNTLTTCIRAECLKELSTRLIKEDLDFVYDYWYWLHVALRGRIRVFYEKTGAYRIHSNGLSRQEGFLKSYRPLVKYDALRKYLQASSDREIKSHSSIIFRTIFLLIQDRRITLNKKLWLFFQLTRKFYLFPVIWNLAFKKASSRSFLPGK